METKKEIFTIDFLGLYKIEELFQQLSTNNSSDSDDIW